MYAYFQIYTHVALWNDTQRTGPVVFRMHTIQHLVEGHHIKKIHLREELIARITIEMTDLSHDLVSIYEPAFGRIERHADDRILEYRPISLRQMLHLAFFLLHLCFISQCGDDVHRLSVLIFSNSASIHIVPVRFALSCIVVIPAIMAIGFQICTIAQALNKCAEPFTIVRVNICITYIYPHIIAEHRLAVQIIHTVILQVETHHVVATDVERHHHGLLLVKHDIHLQSSIFNVQSSIFLIPFLFNLSGRARYRHPYTCALSVVRLYLDGTTHLFGQQLGDRQV